MADPALIEYISAALSFGKPKEEIYKDLLGQGWTIEAIQEGFSALESAAEPEKEKEDIRQKTIRLVVNTGAFFICAGVFSFIASNWEMMGRAAKLLVIVSALLAAYGIGWYLKEKTSAVKTGNAFILLGTLIYGAGIFLVGQMFHVRIDWLDGFLLWMLGTLAMAFAVESYPLFALAAAVGFLGLIGGSAGVLQTLFRGGFSLGSFLVLLVSTGAAFVTGWIFRRRMPSEFQELS